MCYGGSMAEQRTRNAQVVGSIPTHSSRLSMTVFFIEHKNSPYIFIGAVLIISISKNYVANNIYI